MAEKVILFLTDGVPSDSITTIMNRLSSKNALMKNAVIMLTYGLGSSEYIILVEFFKTSSGILYIWYI